MYISSNIELDFNSITISDNGVSSGGGIIIDNVAKAQDNGQEILQLMMTRYSIYGIHTQKL